MHIAERKDRRSLSLGAKIGDLHAKDSHSFHKSSTAILAYSRQASKAPKLGVGGLANLIKQRRPTITAIRRTSPSLGSLEIPLKARRHGAEIN